MRRKILIHPGFHKTGTTTMQRGLKARKAELDTHLEMMIFEDVRPVSLLTRKYSVRPVPETLQKISDAFASVLAERDHGDDRPLLISSESLAGQIPGRKAVQSYAFAPILMDRLIKDLRKWCGLEPEITLWFSTREADAWLESVYFQNVKKMRLTDDLEAFKRAFAQSALLDQVVSEVRGVVPHDVEVTSTSLEVSQQHALGLMGVALDMLGVPCDGLKPPKQQNKQVDGILEELLALNRSDLTDDQLSDAKREVLRLYRTGRSGAD